MCRQSPRKSAWALLFSIRFAYFIITEVSIIEVGTQELLTPYQFSYNNPIRYNDPDGKCPNCLTAVIGAVVGGGVELAGQLLSGKSLKEVDWADVGVETLKGGLLGSGVGAAAAVGIETGGVLAKASLDISLNDGVKTVVDGSKSKGEAIFDGAADVVAGKIAGAVGKKVTHGLEKVAEKSIKAETLAGRDLLRAGNNYNKVTDAGKNVYGINATSASARLDAAKAVSQIAHGKAAVSKTVAKASAGPIGNAAKNGTQNSIVDKVKAFFSF